MQRIITLALVLFTLFFAACTGGKKASSTAEPTSEATSTPSVQSSGDFQLVGRAQHAFVGIGPGVDLSAASSTSDLSATETPEATGTPAASGSFGTASQGGVMRVLLDDASDSLKSNCSVGRDGKINVFWTTSTQFDANLLSDNLESALEGRTVGIVGTIFMSSDTNQSETLGESTASPSASESPSATPNPSCILVADQIGTSSGTIPTPFVRRIPRTAAPTATATPTASPTATPAATASPTSSPAATTAVPSPT